jgi:hypothetical protein
MPTPKIPPVVAPAPAPVVPPQHTDLWMLWGIPADAWLAIGTFCLVAATVLLVVVGVLQIRSIREEEKRKRTLEICAQYETNIVLHLCLIRIATGRLSGDLDVRPERYRSHLTCVLNYLESIDIGIDQGLYQEEIAWDHLEAIVRGHVQRYIDTGVIQRAGMDPQNFRRIIAMRDRWSQARPRFRRRGWI